MNNKHNKILWMLPIAIMAAASVWLVLDRSESNSSMPFGISRLRLLLTAAALLLTFFAYIIFQRRQKDLRFLYFPSGAIIVLSAELFAFSHLPAFHEVRALALTAKRAFPILLPLCICAILWLAALFRSGQKPPLYIWHFFIFCISVLVYWGISSLLGQQMERINFQKNTLLCFLTIAAAVFWLLVLKNTRKKALIITAGCLFFAVLSYSAARITCLWIGQIRLPDNARWNELAEAFLNRRLDLAEPNGYHDLTEYGGKWYVPNPPLPGILLIPWVALAGSASAIDMPQYSSLIAGINAGLFFLLLSLSFLHKKAPLYMPPSENEAYPGSSLSVCVAVTLLFIFGTVHLWLAISGQMWFISQLLVITFTLLASACVICGASPILAGIFLGMGIMCRPNIFPIWLFLLGLWLYQEQDFPHFDLKKTLFWCLKSALPVIGAVFLLLLYNKLRFNNWMDFGYVTIHGNDYIQQAAQKYGIFHPHFIGTNARIMFAALPALDFSGKSFFFQANTDGYSIFLMTPALIYVFRTFRKNWYAIGAWASILLSVILLLMYHNTGSWQVGYRYILDVSAPLSLLCADGMRGKVSVLFRILLLFSIILSFVSIVWWFKVVYGFAL